MYITIDYTRPKPYSMISVDGKDVRDIILGITGSEMIADKYFKEVCDMHFGDRIIANPYFEIDCVPDEKI